MPIIDLRALAAPENRYLHLRGDESLQEAFQRLVAPDLGGQPWWHLVVSLGDGRWAISTFERLYARAQEDRRLLARPLRDLDLLQAKVVDQESMGTATARTLASNSPGSLVVVTREVLMGILSTPMLGGEAVTTKDIQTLLESPLVEESPPASPDRQLVRRHTDVSCPDRVALETPRFSVVVRFMVERSSHDATSQALDFALEEPVRVVLQAPSFEVLNEPVQEVRLLRDQNSPPVVFDLRPRQTGDHRLEIEFYQDTTPLGMVSIPVQVTQAAGASRSAEGSLDLPSYTPGIPPPDLVLRILSTRDFQGQLLRLSLLRHGGAGWDEFPPVRFEEDPAHYAQRLFSGLADLADRASSATGRTRPHPSDEIHRELKKMGQNLWEILPLGLRALYAEERAGWRNRSLLIISDEPHIPWELLWPWGHDWKDEEPWCVTLRLSRWLRRDALENGNAGAPGLLPLHSLACLASGESPAVIAERQILRELVRQHGIKDLSPPVATRQAVMSLLETGGYDWLHFATHGREGALLLEDQTYLTPEDFVGPEIARHLRQQRPSFVLNACDSARQSWGLVGLGGWANRLISLGAGMFLGTLWPVDDASALAFAKAFYPRLLAGEAVAEALRQARLEIHNRNGNDPAWLAYSLYSHPNARVTSSAVTYRGATILAS